MIDFLYFLWMAAGAYRRASTTGRPQYAGRVDHGVPDLCIYVAVGREAWRVSQTALVNLE